MLVSTPRSTREYPPSMSFATASRPLLEKSRDQNRHEGFCCKKDLSWVELLTKTSVRQRLKNWRSTCGDKELLDGCTLCIHREIGHTRKTAVSVRHEKNHLQRILFAKMLSAALKKLSTFGNALPRQMGRGWNPARFHNTGQGAAD